MAASSRASVRGVQSLVDDGATMSCRSLPVIRRVTLSNAELLGIRRKHRSAFAWRLPTTDASGTPALRSEDRHLFEPAEVTGDLDEIVRDGD